MVQVSGCVVQEAFWSRALFLCTIVVQKGVALQVCPLSRSSESTHFLGLRRDVALLDSTRVPDDF